MSQSEYTVINKCFTCFEHYLLFVDFGFSLETSQFLAGLYHVVGSEARFVQIAQDLLCERSCSRIKP